MIYLSPMKRLILYTTSAGKVERNSRDAALTLELSYRRGMGARGALCKPMLIKSIESGRDAVWDGF
jgi:hypothetical protein